jgi:hypothetical protein
MKARRLLAASLAIALVGVPALREALESSMLRHMLVQVPLLLLCGAGLAGGVAGLARERLARWNSHGLAGLFAVALGTALLMVPRLLDLAVADLGIDALKAAGLLACGAALRLSWRPAGALVQGFFLGNVLPMTAAVGQLYQSSPLRLCNAYLLDDQVRLGEALVVGSIAIGAVWFGLLVAALVRSQPEEDALATQPLATSFSRPEPGGKKD